MCSSALRSPPPSSTELPREVPPVKSMLLRNGTSVTIPPGLKRRILNTYGLPVLAVTLTTLVRLALAPALGAVAPLVLYPFAVPVAAWYGGIRAGMLATFLSALAGSFLFITPPGLLIPAKGDDRIFMALFIGVGLGLTLLAVLWRRTLKRVSDGEQHFRLLVDGAVDTAIIALDVQGRVRSWNPGAERIKRYGPDE